MIDLRVSLSMTRLYLFIGLLAISLPLGLISARTAVSSASSSPLAEVADWRSDPAWNEGKAEWALYDARRTVYGTPRSYEATMFTNKQHMDPATMTKASDWQRPGMIEVFKHNLSEMVPTENYTYRFLTTAFVSTESLRLFKLVVSTQEDCGATYKDFTVAGQERLHAVQFSYFPDEGRSMKSTPMSERFAAHDALSLTLRDFPFATAQPGTAVTIDLLPDQTHTHATPLESSRATVRYLGRETITVPYGNVRTHRLLVEHAETGETAESHYWFADDSENLRRVMVRYEGPWGVEYRLKKLNWWAYWDRANSRPD